MVSALVRRSRGLAGDTVLCSWARYFILTVPLSTQEHKWVPVNCWGNLTNCGGVSSMAMGQSAPRLHNSSNVNQNILLLFSRIWGHFSKDPVN